MEASTVASQGKHIAETIERLCDRGQFAEAERVLVAHFAQLAVFPERLDQVVQCIPEDELLRRPGFVAAKLFHGVNSVTVPGRALTYLVETLQSGARRVLSDLHDTKDPASPDEWQIQETELIALVEVMVGDRMKGEVASALETARELESRSAVSRALERRWLDQEIIGPLPAVLAEVGLTGLVSGDLELAKRAWSRLRNILEVPRGLNDDTARCISSWGLASLYGLSLTAALCGDNVNADTLLREAEALRQESGAEAPGLHRLHRELVRALLANERHDEQMFRSAVTQIEPWASRIEQWPLIVVLTTTNTYRTRGAQWALPDLEAAARKIGMNMPGVDAWGMYLQAHRIRLNTWAGNYVNARRLLERMPEDWPIYSIELARLELYQGNHLRALERTQRLGATGLSAREEIDRNLISACAAKELGFDQDAAASWMLTSAAISEFGLFSLLCGVPYETLCSLRPEHQKMSAAIEAIPMNARTLAHRALTAAEQRALESLVTHPKAADAADAYFVTPGTMKQARLSVYRKLHVSSRGAAIVQAQKMGLLPAFDGRASMTEGEL